MALERAGIENSLALKHWRATLADTRIQVKSHSIVESTPVIHNGGFAPLLGPSRYAGPSQNAHVNSDERTESKKNDILRDWYVISSLMRIIRFLCYGLSLQSDSLSCHVRSKLRQ